MRTLQGEGPTREGRGVREVWCHSWVRVCTYSFALAFSSKVASVEIVECNIIEISYSVREKKSNHDRSN